jgi:hypothetical protein
LLPPPPGIGLPVAEVPPASLPPWHTVLLVQDRATDEDQARRRQATEHHGKKYLSFVHFFHVSPLNFVLYWSLTALK